jgi:TP901 family phage tail tape measure protein
MGNLKIVAEIENKIHQQVQQIDSDLQKIAKQAANSGSIMDNAFGKVGNTLDKMGINIPSLIGPAGALAAAFKFKQLAQEALEFEKAFGMAMREVQTISGAVQTNFEGISQQIVDMAANGPDDAIKLAKAYYQIVSAGHDGAAGLELLAIASKAAVAGVTDTLTAADGLTTVINAWGLSANKANFVADIMFKTVERGKTTFSQLASNIAQVAPLAAANNIEFEQIFAALQTITKQGTPTAQAMTQIRSSIVNMTAVLGDGWSKTMTYQDGLNKVREMAGGSQIALKKLIPDVEGVSAVLALTGDKAKGAAEDMNETAKAAGSMETAYGRMMEEANNKWSIVHNKWTREIRELGKAMKDESGNLANFMDALLSKGADIDTNMSIYGIADKIKALRIMGGSLVGSYIQGGLMPESIVREQYAQYIKMIQDYAKQGLSQQQMSLSEILGIKDKDERLTKLNEFLVSMKKAEQDIGNTVFQNNEQQNAALKIRGELWGEVEARAKEAIKVIEGSGGGGGGEAKTRTLKTMLDEIKTAQDSLGTGSMKEDINLLVKISALQQEVLDYYDKIRQARKVESVQAIKPLSGKDSFGGIQTITKEQTKQEFQGEKLLKQSKAKTAAAQKEADAIKAQNERYTKQTVLIEGLTGKLGNASELLGAMSFAIGEFDGDLGQSVGKMADLANNAANMVANFGAGNYVGAIASGIGVIGNIISLTKSDKEDPTTKALENVNALLEKQSAILSNLAGSNYFELAQKQYDDFGKSIELNNTKLQESMLFTKKEWSELQAQFKQWQKDFPNPSIKFDTWVKNQWSETDGWTPQNFIDAYTEGTANLNDQQIEWVKSIVDAQKARAELLQETFRTALGFDASDVSDAIFQGIEDGLMLGQNSLGGFAQSFGKLMQKALMQSVTDSLNLSITESFLPMYQKFMEDNLLSNNEVETLRGIYSGLIDQAQIDSANIKSITGPLLDNTKQSPLVGSIAGASEETMSLVAGLNMTLVRDTKINQNLIQNQLELMDASLSTLQTIAGNTKHNSVLPEIRDELKSMNDNIKKLQ